MKGPALAAVLIGSASMTEAEPFSLVLPLDCTLGETCHVQQLVDHDFRPEAKDYLCGSMTYDGHKGSDFGLPTHQEMAAGVTVRAAAAGVVIAVRDGEADRVYAGGDLDGRDCGNGLVIDHGDGWETQYCHLRRGSLSVSVGQPVETSTPLGLVGLSGRTEFPHLHFSVRRDGAVVDPFAPGGATACGSETSLWSEPLEVPAGGLLAIGFASRVPSYDAVKSGTADDTPPRRDTALVGYGYAFGGRAADVMRIVIEGPLGEVVSNEASVDRNQALFFRAAGRKRQAQGWPKGDYSLTVSLLREGNLISKRRSVLSMR